MTALAAVKLPRYTKKVDAIRHDYAKAALTGLLASGAHNDVRDEDKAIALNCERAKKYGHQMFLLNLFGG